MDDAKFKIINDAYSAYYRDLLRQGKLPLKDTGIGFWGYTIGEEAYEFFKSFALQKYKMFLDLGSGDGKVTAIASLFTSAHGMEFDEPLLHQSVTLAKSLQLNAQFMKRDFMKEDLSQYDVLYIYPDKRLVELEDKLLKEMRGVLIVHGPHFHPLRLKKVSERFIGTNPFVVFARP